MLRNLTLRFGPTGADFPLEFTPAPMTVFVGPNNSGKSLALREIEDFLDSGGRSERRIVRWIDFDLPTPDEARGMLESRRVDDGSIEAGDALIRVSRMKPMGEYVMKRATDVSGDLPTEQLLDFGWIARMLETPEGVHAADFARLCRDFLALFAIRLDGRTRLALTYPRPMGDLQLHPTNHLAALFRDDEARQRIRQITADAFGLHFVLDPTGGTHLRIRMSDRAPEDDAEEQALDERARSFHAAATDISEMSDGVKAFTGLTAAVLSADYRIMLVDEPEAFLHPPLIRKLGRRLTQLAAERHAHVLASTHSPDFVMGCVQAGKGVNIVRLTYKKGVPSATLLPADKLQSMMRDPLLRSTGVLGALFHEGAIVCEADADRVFYQEVNERLLASGRGGADGCIFLNAQNKQTIRRIVRPLREMGIPAAAIVDLDILKGKEDFRDLMRAAFVPEVFVQAWEEMRAHLQQKIRNESFKDGGIYTLGREVRASAELLLDSLTAFGVFIVPSGELECWLPALEVGGHGPEWLTQVFERMGTDSNDESYLRPGEGDVWRFMQRLAAWVGDPHRKGMAEETLRVDHLLPPAETEDAQSAA
ncbi:MAG: ATP-binding protein [Gemmatimonadetes bacterium]|nr:ATP-binding protein [Gemmatimonadota bacterium]